MTDFAKTAAALRELAAQVEDTARFQMEADACDIGSAAACLRALLGRDTYFSIKVELDYHTNAEKPTVKWRIYDGDKFLEGSTLQDAVKAVAIKHNSKEQSADDVQEALTGKRPQPVAAGVDGERSF